MYGNLTYQWRVQDFPEVEAPTLQGAPTYDFAKFSQKLDEIERIWTLPPGRSVLCSLPPPSSSLRSANGLVNSLEWLLLGFAQKIFEGGGVEIYGNLSFYECRFKKKFLCTICTHRGGDAKTLGTSACAKAPVITLSCVYTTSWNFHYLVFY